MKENLSFDLSRFLGFQTHLNFSLLQTRSRFQFAAAEWTPHVFTCNTTRDNSAIFGAGRRVPSDFEILTKFKSIVQAKFPSPLLAEQSLIPVQEKWRFELQRTREGKQGESILQFSRAWACE